VTYPHNDADNEAQRPARRLSDAEILKALYALAESEYGDCYEDALLRAIRDGKIPHVRIEY